MQAMSGAMQAVSGTILYTGASALNLVGMNFNVKQPGWIVFVTSWMNKNKEAGTPFSTSTYVAEKMVRHIPMADANTPRKYLEIGPGTGVVTDLFIEKLGPNDTLHVVEIEEGFYKYIKERYENDPRVIVHLADISEWSVKDGADKDIQFDAIAAGVPLNGLPNETVLKSVLIAYERLAKKGAKITVVEYVGTSSVSRMFKGEEFQKVFDLKCKFLEHHKSKKAEIEWRNFPVPARVHTLAINDSYFKNE